MTCLFWHDRHHHVNCKVICWISSDYSLSSSIMLAIRLIDVTWKFKTSKNNSSYVFINRIDKQSEKSLLQEEKDQIIQLQSTWRWQSCWNRPFIHFQFVWQEEQQCWSLKESWVLFHWIIIIRTWYCNNVNNC